MAPPRSPAEPVAMKADRKAERRTVSGLVLARLLGSKAACDEIRLRHMIRSDSPLSSFARAAASHAITFADALLDALDEREAREAPPPKPPD